MTDFIYLDHNSTTPIDPSVASAVSDCYADQLMNPASQHRLGQVARRKLEQLRRRMAEILGASCTGMETDQLLLTSGGTESNNLALLGLVSSASQPDNRTGRVLISAIEHPSVIGAAEQLARMGYDVEKIPVDQNGVCQIASLKKIIDASSAGSSNQTILVSMMLVNNETGVIQPVAEAAAFCRQRGILFHTDAVQAVGKIPVQFRELGIDAMSFTAHKFHGPRSIGGLLLRHGLSPHPILYGGFQQMAIRPGTEDVALAAGMCQALELYQSDSEGRYEHLLKLRDRLQAALVGKFGDLVVNGGDALRAPHTLNISFPGIDRQSFLLAADMAGLAISTGSACASGSSELSPVLLAMGLENRIVEGSIRISLGVSTTEAEIDDAASRITSIIASLGAKK